MIEALGVHTITTDCNQQLGVLTLNDPTALNALSIEMCQAMSAQLTRWHNDDTIVAIILRGSGNKAFCAGGNIRNLYDSMLKQQTNSHGINPYAQEFFGNEYRLYRQMHFYHKPIILWSDGIVMGGGMGLMAMSSHRVVTNNTRFAMPEISIGLYPDATGSWMLQRMPNKTGLFLGLTGAHGNGADALVANMAEYAVTSDQYDCMINALKIAHWCDATLDGLHTIASRALASIHTTEDLAESNIIKHWQVINEMCNKGSIVDIDHRLQSPQLAQQYVDDKWMTSAISRYKHGCPVSAVLTYEMFQRAKHLSLEQVLYLELNISLNCANNPDFQEGVRALIIDKDRLPTWSRTLAECMSPQGREYINAHFDSPYQDHQHPFASWLSADSWSVASIQ